MVRVLGSSLLLVTLATAVTSCQKSTAAEVSSESVPAKGLKHSYFCSGVWENSNVEVSFENKTYSNGKSGQEFDYTYNKARSSTSIALDMDDPSQKATTVVEDELGVYVNLGTMSIMLAPAPLTRDERSSGLKREVADEFKATLIDLNYPDAKRVVDLNCKIK
jgi:hypothetical protein